MKRAYAEGFFVGKVADINDAPNGCLVNAVIDKDDDYSIKVKDENGDVFTVGGGASGVTQTVTTTILNPAILTLASIPVEVVPAIAGMIINPITQIMSLSNIITPILSAGLDVSTYSYFDGVPIPIDENIFQYESQISSSIDIIMSIPNNNSPTKDRQKLLVAAPLMFSADLEPNASDVVLKITTQYNVLPMSII